MQYIQLQVIPHGEQYEVVRTVRESFDVFQKDTLT